MTRSLFKATKTYLRVVPACVVMASLMAVGCSDGTDSNDSPSGPPAEDRAYYILPPGNYGGLPTTQNSLDQLPLYDALTPLRGNVTDEDIEQLFLPEDFQPIGETFEVPTGRPGTTIIYDEFGIAHITGETREDMAFGAGWVTVRDRELLISLGRGPARAAVADVPCINAFSLVTSGQSFIPSAATEKLVTDQADLLREVFGEEGQQIIDEAQAYADGMNAYHVVNGGAPEEPYAAADVFAVTAFIGSIFGAGGGSEPSNSEFRSQLINGLGDGQGQLAFDDVMLINQGAAPTTIDTPFDYGRFTGGEVTGSVTIDEGSIVNLDCVVPAGDSGSLSTAASGALVPATDTPLDREASNFLIADGSVSASGSNLAVMGPQLGYYYPEIVMQIHLSAPGIEAQGAAVPGLGMYLLLGRTPNYAWSLTSASHDVRDVFAEVLCNPDGSEPTRESRHYEFKGQCIAFEIFDAGTLNGDPVIYPVSVHGPMLGTATVNGKPIALTRKRSTFGRDALNLAGLKDMTEGDASTPEAFYKSANKFGFTFNWGYMSRSNTAFFSSGFLPERAPGLDRVLPTNGNGDYEWQGFLGQAAHPHSIGGPSGRLLNWNNQSAPGFMHGDGTPYGSIHRVQLFDQWPDRVDLAGVVGIMNRSATEDERSPAWPVVSEVLDGSEAPSQLAEEVVALLDAWVADDAPRLDADDDGFNDDAGYAIMQALWEPLASEVMRPVFGDLTGSLNSIRRLGGNNGSSFIQTDLSTLLGKEPPGQFNLLYCGGGDLDTCRESLWLIVELVSEELAIEFGNNDPNTWLPEATTISFTPGLIPNTMRGTSRPTFQQVLEFAPQ